METSHPENADSANVAVQKNKIINYNLIMVTHAATTFLLLFIIPLHTDITFGNYTVISDIYNFYKNGVITKHSPPFLFKIISNNFLLV